MLERAQGTLPSNTKPNPRGQVNAIFLGSVKETPIKPIEDETMCLRVQEIPPEPKDEEIIKLREPNTHTQQLENNEQKKKGRLFADEPIQEYKPRIPYPQTTIQNNVKAQHGKFLELFKELNINIPFVDALLNMPKYVKYLKDIMSNKRKLEE